MNCISRNRILSILLLFLTGMFTQAQVPVLKTDLDIGSRKESEVNEPGYIPWPQTGGPSAKTIEGVKFIFKNGTIDGSWYKAGVQAPYYARLVNDGIKAENVELHIIGLQNGKHSLVTFHNNFDNPETNVFSLLDIYVNDELIVDDLEPSTRALSNDDATTAYMEFEVTGDDTVVIRFQADPLPASTNLQIPVCGFHLNTSDPKKMARFEYPVNKDEHVDIDDDTLVFLWQSPDSTVSHNFYFGSDEINVLLANTSSPQFIGNIVDTFLVMDGFYSMETYYWRVDPIGVDGDTIRGDVWYFKKRIPAFPGAEGHGRYAIGGRGGKVVYVTNLEDSGPGSFRDAVENHEGPRTILFDVSGLITLNSRLVASDDYITIAGQTAPGKGVCFRWAPIGLTGDNLIVQHLRLRLGGGKTYDGMGLTGANHSIIDHCSISWTLDEAFSSRGGKNITLQRTLISEALNIAGHSNYPSMTAHGYAASIGGDIGSFHHNLLAHCEGRNWSLAGGLDGDGYYAGRLDIFNNLVYNWGGRATDGGAHEVNFVNNYYKKGSATTQNTILNAQIEGTGKGTQSYYYSGNIVKNKDGSFACDGTNNACSRMYTLSNGQVLNWTVFVNKPFFQSEATIHGARDSYKNVLSDVGCTQPVLDDHDIRIINETLEGTFTYRGSVTNKAGLPDSEKDVGGWEKYPGFKRAAGWDSDEDGLPNWWEEAHGLDSLSAPGDFSESNADDDRNGYTNLEEFLQWMSNPHYFVESGESIEINLSQYTRGFTNDPAFDVSGVVNGDVSLEENSSVVRFTPVAEGLAEFSYKVSDAEGSSMSQKIGLFVGEVPADSFFNYTYYKDRSKTVLVYVGEGPLAVPEKKLDNHYFNVYPNPANNNLNVSLESGDDPETGFLIFDVGGQIRFQKKYYLQQGLDIVNIDISSLSPGIYTLKVNNSHYSGTIQFVKK